MKEAEAKELKSRAEKVVGKEMKYKELADSFNMEYAYGNSKKKQLNDIAEVCDIEVLPNPTRYIIHSVYADEDIMLFGGKYQKPFEYAISKLLESNCYENVYITNTQLLLYLSLVNENYKILKSPKLRKQLEAATGDKQKYDTLYQASCDAGQILKKWADRLMKNMERRGLILYRKGFCLISEQTVDGIKVHNVHNVPFSTSLGDTENRILYCWSQAAKDFDIDRYKNDYIPPNLRESFYSKFNSYIKEEFDGKYIAAYKCNVITSSKNANVQFIEDVEKMMNDKAYDYIKLSKDVRLQNLTGLRKQELLDEVIKVPPIVKYNNIH